MAISLFGHLERSVSLLSGTDLLFVALREEGKGKGYIMLANAPTDRPQRQGASFSRSLITNGSGIPGTCRDSSQLAIFGS